MLSDKDANKLQFPVGFRMSEILNGCFFFKFQSVWRLGRKTLKTEQIQWLIKIMFLPIEQLDFKKIQKKKL